MSELDVFENRFKAAYRRYLDEAPTEVDAAEVARTVTAAHRRGRMGVWPWALRPAPALAWLVLLALLLAALGAAALFVGSQPSAPGLACPSGSTPDKPGQVDQAAPLGDYLKMAFDGDSAKIVALAGQWDGGTGSWETWTFDVCANSWSRARPDREPAISASRETQLVYDADSDLTIAIAADGTWAYDLEANSWTEKRESPPTGASRLAYDPVSDLVFVQEISSGDEFAPPQKLWTYDVDTDTWDEVRQTGDLPPGGSGDHLLLAYDPSVDRLVAVGRNFTRLFDPRSGDWSAATLLTPTLSTPATSARAARSPTTRQESGLWCSAMVWSGSMTPRRISGAGSVGWYPGGHTGALP